MRAFAQINPTRPRCEVEIYVTDKDHIADFTNVMMVPRGEMNAVEPNVSPLRLSREAAQELVDCLVAAGIRPNNGEGGPAQVKALEKHIDDLRTIAFHMAKVPR